MNCPVCSHKKSTKVFSHSNQPKYALQKHLTLKSALECESVPVEFVFCENCLFVYNRLFDVSKMTYEEDIETGRAFSPSFIRYIDSVINQIDAVFKIKNKRILELGCGDGSFLNQMRKAFIFEGKGFDPSLAKSIMSSPLEGISLVPRIFDSRKEDFIPNVIIMRHIMEHIGAPKDFLINIFPNKEILRELGLYVEVPDWTWIAKNDQIMMFSSDHCSYYTSHSLAYLMKEFGFDRYGVSFSFADEYLQFFAARNQSSDGQFESLLSNQNKSWVDKNYDQIKEETENFVERIPENLARYKSYFDHPNNDAVLWGAAGKGTVLLTTLGITKEQLPYVVDKNPRKHGTFIPLCGQEIVAPSFLSEIRPKTVLITNPIYRSEIQNELQSLGLDAKIVPIE